MTSFSSIGTVVNTVWSLIFIAPLYIVLSTILCRTLLYVYQLARTKSSYIYRYLGDITWAFPFTSTSTEFNLTQIILMAVALALLSMLVLGFMIYSSYGEEKYQKLKKQLLEEIKQQTTATEQQN